MMEVLNVILPPVITGILTFLITKYQCQKKVPLEKMEKAYNKVYFPIYQLIRNESNEREEIIKTSEEYLNKYIKYVDRSTLLAFKVLINASGEREKNTAYGNYESNIINFNSKLRRQLGYLEPNVLNMYTYSSKSDQRMLRVFLEISIFYILIVLYSLIKNENISSIIFAIYIFIFLVLICELILFLVAFIVKRIKTNRK